MQNCLGEFPQWSNLRNQFSHFAIFALSGLLLLCQHHFCINSCGRWQSSFITVQIGKVILLCYCKGSALRGIQPIHHSNYLSELDSPSQAAAPTDTLPVSPSQLPNSSLDRTFTGICLSLSAFCLHLPAHRLPCLFSASPLLHHTGGNASLFPC